MGGFPIAPQTPFGVIRGDGSGVSPLECLVPGGQFVRYGTKRNLRNNRVPRGQFVRYGTERNLYRGDSLCGTAQKGT